MINQLKPVLGKLTCFAQNRLGFKDPPSLFLKRDAENSSHILGKTAFYNPSEKSITIFISKRHPKDILRSFAHELVHHVQNLRGDFCGDKIKNLGPNYAQNNQHMRNMEKEAYLIGNLCFRDWEDSLDDKTKYQMSIAEEKFIKENKQMTRRTKKTIKEITGLGDMARDAADKPELTTLEAEAMVRSMIDMFSDDNDAFGVMQTLDKMGPEFGRGPGNMGGEVMNALQNVYGALLKANNRAPGQSGNPYSQGDQQISESKLVKENKKMTKKINKKDLKNLILEALKEQALTVSAPLDPGTEMKPGMSPEDGGVTLSQKLMSVLSLLGIDQPGAQQPFWLVNSLKQDSQIDGMALLSGIETALNSGKTADQIKNLGSSWLEDQEDKIGASRTADACTEIVVTKTPEGGIAKRPGTVMDPETQTVAEFLGIDGLCGVQEGGCSKRKDLEENEELEEEMTTGKLAAASGNPNEVEPEDFEKAFGENKIQTPEQESTLYEQRFTPRNNIIFEKLLKKWTK